MKYSKFDDDAKRSVEDDRAVDGPKVIEPAQIPDDGAGHVVEPAPVINVVEKKAPSLLTEKQKKKIEKKTRKYEYKRTLSARRLDVDKNLGMSAMKVVQFSKKLEMILMGITLVFNTYYYFGIPIICYIFQLDSDLFDNYADVLVPWNKYVVGFTAVFAIKSLFETKWERQNKVDLALGVSAPTVSKEDDSSLDKLADKVSKVTDVIGNIMDAFD